MDEKDRLITAALAQYPLEPVPSDFSRRVMAQIQTKRPAPQPAAIPPLFRLEFSDLAVPFFVALFVTLMFSGALVGLALVDPLQARRMEIELLSYLNHLPLAAIVVGGGVSGLALIGLGGGVLALLVSTSNRGVQLIRRPFRSTGG